MSRSGIMTLNFHHLLHDNTKMKISPDAVKEYVGFIAAYTESNAKELEHIAKRKGRKTIMVEDVVEFFSNRYVNVGGEE